LVEYLSGNRIQGSSSVGAVDTLGTTVNGTNSGTVTDNNTPFYGDTTVAFDNNDAVHDLGTTSSFAGLVKEDFTVIFWAKASAVGNGGAGSNNGWGSGSSSNTYAGNQGTILNCGQVSGNGSTQGFVISFDDEGSEEFYMWMGDGNGNCILNDVIGSNDVADTDNNWHLYMFHFDNTNSQVKIYRDGGSSAIQTTSYASQVSSTSSTTYKKMFMGRQSDDDARYFIGSLADVSIWKRLVTTTEFNTLWGTFQDNTSTATNSVKGVRVDSLSDQSGLLAHWKLDDLNFTNSASATDEKDSLTNVPLNTRYEETDTRKIYRRSNNSSSLGSPDLEITDASGWSTSGSGLSINSSGVITHTSSMSANARLEKSLGFTLGDTWTIDYEFTRTSSSGNNVRPLVVASSADNINDSGTDNNVVGHYGDTNWNAFKKVGTGAGAGLGWIAGDTTKRYMRLSRTSDTNFRLEVYTDSARTTRVNSNCAGYTDAEYNFNGCSVMNSVGNGMIDYPISAGTVTGLDTLISGNGSSANGHSGIIENIKVYNNKLVQSNFPQKYGNPNANADVNYGTYKQIRNLIPNDVITGVTIGIYNASADFKVALFTDSSNAPSTRLGTTTTKTGVSVSNTYTNYEITLDTPVTVPSDGKVWVCAYPSTTIKFAVRVDSGSDWYNSRYQGTSHSYANAFPSTMWASTGQGTYNPMFGVIIGAGQWKERGVA